jgi:hypothetical protein
MSLPAPAAPAPATPTRAAAATRLTGVRRALLCAAALLAGLALALLALAGAARAGLPGAQSAGLGPAGARIAGAYLRGAAPRDVVPPGSWAPVSVPVTVGHYALTCLNPSDCWIANGRQVYTTDPPSTTQSPLMRWNGAQWSIVPGSPLASGVDFAAPDDGWAVWGECERFYMRWCRGRIYRWDGASWTVITDTARYALVSVTAVAPDDVWFVGGELLLHDDRPQHITSVPAVFHWDGATLRSMDPPQESQCMAREARREPGGPLWIACTDVAGGVGALLRYDDAAGWTYSDYGSLARPVGLDFSGPGTGWAASELALLRYVTSTWQIEPLPARELYAIDVLPGGQAWAVGDAGGILHFDGAAWSPATSPVSNTLVDVVISSPFEGWAISYDRFPPGGSDVVLRWQQPPLARTNLPLMIWR